MQDDNSTSVKVASATPFFARGWHVLVLHDVTSGRCSCGAELCLSKPADGGKHPRGGAGWQFQAVADPAGLAAKLAALNAPYANLGILTGQASGVFVLDEDPKNGGDVALRDLQERHGPLPYTYTVRTGSGGHHYYFALPGDFTPTNSSGRLPAGLDIRGEGGQVVAPGSVTGSGSYEVAVDASVSPAPGWLLELIRPRAVTEAAQIPGQRTDGFYDAAAVGMGAGSAPDPRAHGYAVSAVRMELGRLAEATPGRRGSTAYAVACNLIELMNSEWAGLDAAQVWAGYEWAVGEALAYGGKFSMAEAHAAWRSAARTVQHRGRAVPAFTDTGEVVAAPDWAVPGVAPFGAAGPPDAANPFGPLNPAHTPLTLGVSATDPEVMRRVRQLEVDRAAKEIIRAREENGASERRAALRAQFLTADQMAEQPGPQPLVEGLLYLDSTAWMIGKSGSYKSFVALDLAAHVATGRAWRGKATVAGTVVYLAAEGARGMAPRTRAWVQRYAPIGDKLVFLPLPVSAADEQAWGDLVAVLAEIGPVLVIADTQARLSVGLEENSNTDMMRYVQAVDDMRRATGACVLTVHHIGRNGSDARGASAIDGAQDTELRVERISSKRVRLHQDKQKEGDDSAKLDLTLEPCGESLVLTPFGALAVGMSLEDERASRREQNRATMLDHLVGLLRDVYADTSETKAGIRRALFERMGLAAKDDRERSSTFDKAWGRVVSGAVVGQIRGTQRYRFIAPEDRAKLTEPAASGGGWVAPDVTESGPPAPVTSDNLVSA